MQIFCGLPDAGSEQKSSLPVLRLLRLRGIFAVRQIDKVVVRALAHAAVQLRQQPHIRVAAAVVGLDGIEVRVARDEHRLPRADLLRADQRRAEQHRGTQKAP